MFGKEVYKIKNNNVISFKRHEIWPENVFISTSYLFSINLFFKIELGQTQILMSQKKNIINITKGSNPRKLSLFCDTLQGTLW
jgi:hypothetical protein